MKTNNLSLVVISAFLKDSTICTHTIEHGCDPETGINRLPEQGGKRQEAEFRVLNQKRGTTVLKFIS
jgi:hypothetical protein